MPLAGPAVDERPRKPRERRGGQPVANPLQIGAGSCATCRVFAFDRFEKIREGHAVVGRDADKLAVIHEEPGVSVQHNVARVRISVELAELKNLIPNHFENADTLCQPCPVGAQCQEGTVLGTLSLLDGYWRLSPLSKLMAGRTCGARQGAR